MKRRPKETNTAEKVSGSNIRLKKKKKRKRRYSTKRHMQYCALNIYSRHTLFRLLCMLFCVNKSQNVFVIIINNEFLTRINNCALVLIYYLYAHREYAYIIQLLLLNGLSYCSPNAADCEI